MVSETMTAVSEEDVGDEDSFKRKKTYLGVAQTDVILMSTDCALEEIGEDEVCVDVVPAPGTTIVNFSDLGSISLPRNASKLSALFHSNAIFYLILDQFYAR